MPFVLTDLKLKLHACKLPPRAGTGKR
jgi:hypothetical protein